MNERLKYKVLFLTYKSLKTGQPPYPARFFHSLHIVVIGLPLLSPLVTLLSLLVLKLQTDLIIILLLFLWNSLPSDLRHVAQHVTPSPILNSPVSDHLTSIFHKKVKSHIFHVPFLLN